MTRVVAMLDYETTGLSLDCSLVAAGIVVADLDNPEFIVLHSYYDKILFDKEVNPLKFDDVDTLLWWFKQSDEAQQAFDQRHAKPLHEVLDMINYVISQYTLDEFISKGADFDIAITLQKMRKFGIRPAWSYKIQGCFRTYERQFKLPQLEIAHKADVDAFNQLKALHTYLHQVGAGVA